MFLNKDIYPIIISYLSVSDIKNLMLINKFHFKIISNIVSIDLNNFKKFYNSFLINSNKINFVEIIVLFNNFNVFRYYFNISSKNNYLEYSCMHDNIFIFSYFKIFNSSEILKYFAISCLNGSINILKYLYNRYNLILHDINLKKTLSIIKHIKIIKNGKYDTKKYQNFDYISLACRNNHINVAKWLLSLNFTFDNKDYIFKSACINDYLDTVIFCDIKDNLLIQKGLKLAKKYNNINIINYLQSCKCL